MERKHGRVVETTAVPFRVQFNVSGAFPCLKEVLDVCVEVC